MPMSEEEKKIARREAIKRYDKENDRINCRLPGGTVERIKKLGYKSANAFILQATMERIEREETRLKG